MTRTLTILPNRTFYEGGRFPIQQTPYTIEIDLPKEKALAKIMDFLTTNHFPIKTVDTGMGFVQTQSIGLGSHFSIEGKTLMPQDWVLCERKLEPGKDSLLTYPNIVNGDLQIFVREISPNRCKINISLHNFNAYQLVNEDQKVNFKATSTSKLEQIIAQFVAQTTETAVPVVKLDAPDDYFVEPASQLAIRSAVALKESKVQEKKSEASGVFVMLLLIGLLILGASRPDEE